MKITAFSDTHGICFPRIKKCDVVCICGDFIPLDYQRSTELSLDWLKTYFIPKLKTLRCNKVLLVPGNHDFVFERVDKAELKKIIQDGSKGKCLLLMDEVVEVDGKMFFGSPWCTGLPNWAFYTSNPNHTYSVIPEGVDVLLTHQPPLCMNLGRVNQTSAYNYDANYGSLELTNRIMSINPKYVFCGHVHSGSHELQELNGTKMANVSLVDERYHEAYKPLIVDID